MKVVRSRKMRSRHPFYRRKGLQKAFLGLLLGGAMVYLFLFSPVFQREHLIIEGTQAVAEEDIREASKDFLAGRLTASLVWPIGRLPEFLKESFSYVGEARVVRRWPDTLVISLKERTPAFCVGEQEKVALLDEKGNFLEETSSACPSSLPMIVLSDEDLPNGPFMPAELWLIVSQINQTLSPFEELALNEIRVDRLRVEIVMANPVAGQPEWKIYLDRMTDAAKQLRRVELFLRTKSLEELSRLDYVNVGGHEERVFYANRSDEGRLNN